MLVKEGGAGGGMSYCTTAEEKEGGGAAGSGGTVVGCGEVKEEKRKKTMRLSEWVKEWNIGEMRLVEGLVTAAARPAATVQL